MTDFKLLALTKDFLAAQQTVVYAMVWAMGSFEQGDEDESWVYLFEWCEDKDRRDELFNKLKNEHQRAMMLKEGYEV